MTSVDSTSATARRDQRLAIAWAVFLVAVVGASWYKAAENQRDERVRTAWQSRMAILEAESEKEYARIRDYLRAGVRSQSTAPLSRSALESEFNEGRPFDLEVNEERMEARWTHPKYGIPIRLSFNNDLLTGYGMTGGSPMIFPENAQPKQRRYDSRAEAIRKTARSLSVYAWLAATAVALASRKHAWFAAQAMLASAILYGAATVVSPYYNLTLQGIFSNDAMFWAVLMYVMALVALAKTWPAASIRPQFGLRRLLLATTAFALLVAIGPLGYFALAVFTIGGFVLVGILARRMEEVRQ